MTIRERMLAFYRRQDCGRIPVAAYDSLLPRGETERKVRDRGLGLISTCPVSSLISPSFLSRTSSSTPNVHVTLRHVFEGGQKVLIRTFETPIGVVHERYGVDSSEGRTWLRKHLIEEPADYDIVRFIVQDNVISEDAASYGNVAHNLHDDGIVLALVDRTPFQKVLWELAGPERLVFDLNDNPSRVENLLGVIEAQLDIAYRIVSTSAAPVVWCPDNLTGDICSPTLFSRYHRYYYKRWAQVLHDKGKIYAVHMDGRLNSLKELIRETPVDVVESFSLPVAGGDLPIRDAGNAWDGKAVAVNFPASLCLAPEAAIRSFVDQFLDDSSGIKNCMLQVSEDLPPDAWQKFLTVIMDSVDVRFGRFSEA